MWIGFKNEMNKQLIYPHANSIYFEFENSTAAAGLQVCLGECTSLKRKVYFIERPCHANDD